ncbi:MAG: hypothetical protein NZ960_07975 [Candidatus Kapabacteria bacterium]|nr:hypothetical protein [Candidatus Kapabacteria bacterium]MDW8012881.1 hypothetical protein [Bacteroidota bacterium]
MPHYLLPPLGLNTCRFTSPHDSQQLIEAAWRSGVRLFASAPSDDDGFGQTILGDWSTQTGQQPLVLVALGLVEGILYHRALEREHEGRPYPEFLRLREGLGYCIHPEFLQEQLAECYQRLRQGAVAGVMLQTPETFLQWARMQGLPEDEAVHELLRRLEQAFAFLEEEARRERLGAYGIQSEALLSSPETPIPLSLPELIAVASSAGGEHHRFRLLAIPFNLFEAAAATETVIEGRTLLEYAMGQALHVIAYRPLSARLGQRPVLIAEPPVEKTTLVSVEHIRGLLREFLRTETQLLRLLTEQPLNGVQREMLRESLTLSLFLQDHWHEFASYEDWSRVRQGYITERLRSLSDIVTPLLQTERARQEWEHYVQRLHQALADIGRLYAARAWERARHLRTVLEDALHVPIPPVPLAQLAIALVQRTEGIGTVLVSSTSPDHIAENASAERLQLPVLQRQHWLRLRAAEAVLEHGF